MCHIREEKQQSVTSQITSKKYRVEQIDWVLKHFDDFLSKHNSLVIYIVSTKSATSLSFCQLKEPEKAAAAAYTYFQANPEHMEIDMKQYKALHGVKEKHFIDREARPHQASELTICLSIV